jgi:carbon monoxide dehydrogenase subunit G
MKLERVVTVPAAQTEVWKLFLDPTQLCKVIPGCEQAQQLNETHYEAVLAVKIQFMTIRSKAKGSILTAEEPRLLVGELIGEPLVMAGAFRARVTLELEPVGDAAQSTPIHYAMDLTMLGPPGQYGRGYCARNFTETHQGIRRERLTTLRRLSLNVSIGRRTHLSYRKEQMDVTY